MRPQKSIRRFASGLSTLMMCIGFVLFFTFAVCAAGDGGDTTEITREMVSQADGDLSQIMAENQGVIDGFFDMGTHFMKTWLEVPKIKFSASLMKLFMPRYRGDVPVPDADLIYSWIQGLCQWEHRRPGSDGGHAAEQWIADKFREFGLHNVTADPIDIDYWKPDQWSLTVEGEDIPCFFSVNTGLTDTAGVTAPLAYVGLGLPTDFDRVDVEGKIAVVEVLFPYLPSGALLSIPNSSYFVSDPGHSINFFTGQMLTFIYMNIWGDMPEWDPLASDVPMKQLWNVYDTAVDRGAKGVALLLANKPSRYNSQYGLYDGVMDPVPAVWVGKYDAIRLRRLARQEKTATLVQAGSITPGYMSNVWGVLPGQSNDTIIVCSHQDSAFQGAVEDGTGIAQVFAQAWAWSRVPRWQRPKTLVFVAAAGHLYGGGGGFAFGHDHSDIMQDAWVLMNLEHLAAKEVMECMGEYKANGRVFPSIIWTEENPKVLAALWKAVDKKPPRRAVSLPAHYWIPFSDAPGYIAGAAACGVSEVPLISWISSPYYLLDEQDTLDKVQKEELQPIAATVTEIVKNFMVMRTRP